MVLNAKPLKIYNYLKNIHLLFLSGRTDETFLIPQLFIFHFSFFLKSLGLRLFSSVRPLTFSVLFSLTFSTTYINITLIIL